MLGIAFYITWTTDNIIFLEAHSELSYTLIRKIGVFSMSNGIVFINPQLMHFFKNIDNWVSCWCEIAQSKSEFNVMLYA